MARIRIISPDGKSATVPEENLQKALDRGFRLEKKDSQSLSSFTKEHISPVSFPVINKLEELGGQVKDVATESFRNISQKPLPQLPRELQVPVEAFRQMGSIIGETAIQSSPFTPSEFAIGLGAELLPLALARSKGIYPTHGKAIMEETIPSTPKEIRKATRTDTKTAADRVLELPKSGSSRAEILKNSRQEITNLEDTIQQELSTVSKSARQGTGKEVIVEGMPLLSAPSKAEVRPSSESFEFPLASPRPRKVSEPDIVSLPSKDMETIDPYALSAQESREGQFWGGQFHGETPKEIKYMQELRRQAQRETFKQLGGMKLPPAPDYGFKIPNKLAIGKDEFLDVFDVEIARHSRIPTAGREVRALKRLKKEYIESAPDVADVSYWNDVKRDIYERLGDNAYLSIITSAQKKLEKSFASSIMRKINERVPGLKNLNREQGNLIEIRDAIIESSPKEVQRASFTRPFFEKSSIRAARFLTKPRSGFTGGLGLSLPLIAEDEE